jgi:hypothetical protein
MDKESVLVEEGLLPDQCWLTSAQIRFIPACSSAGNYGVGKVETGSGEAFPEESAILVQLHMVIRLHPSRSMHTKHMNHLLMGFFLRR